VRVRACVCACACVCALVLEVCFMGAFHFLMGCEPFIDFDHWVTMNCYLLRGDR